MQAPSFGLKILSCFDASLKMLLPSLGHEVKFDNSKVIITILYIFNVQWKVEISEMWRTYNIAVLETHNLEKCTNASLYSFIRVFTLIFRIYVDQRSVCGKTEHSNLGRFIAHWKSRVVLFLT